MFPMFGLGAPMINAARAGLAKQMAGLEVSKATTDALVMMNQINRQETGKLAAQGIKSALRNQFDVQA
jgi:hypothetical protein